MANISEMPLIRGADLDSGNAEKLARFTQASDQGGFVFSSGGTSGAPKYIVYTHDEFSQVADLLATGFRAQGIRAGTVVANLFVAGNLWSSFMAVDHALAKIGASVLPIGGLADKDQTLTYLERFKPKYVVGLPTQLVELARHAKDTGRSISMPAVLYAGEHLSLVARKFLETVAGTTHFGSAGYASVDAGPIGYQCGYGVGGVHHLFAENVHLEIINGEGVVTSRIKRKMPVIRLCTGDLLEWISEKDEACQCGSRDIRFRLLGRSDSQFNIWACRLFINDFEKALADCNLDGALFQIVLKQDDVAQETIEFHVEHDMAEQLEPGFLVNQVYSHSKDLQAQHPLAWVSPRLLVVAHASGSIARVSRTGKIKALVDKR
ncbi:MAG: phenylacetate--CoA ligase family protein [Proteobacteria bacterium]|nr:phenylacetate--CoA ligase family protein [Pseudomonadota bacterium]